MLPSSTQLESSMPWQTASVCKTVPRQASTSARPELLSKERGVLGVVVSVLVTVGGRSGELQTISYRWCKVIPARMWLGGVCSKMYGAEIVLWCSGWNLGEVDTLWEFVSFGNFRGELKTAGLNSDPPPLTVFFCFLVFFEIEFPFFFFHFKPKMTNSTHAAGSPFIQVGTYCLGIYGWNLKMSSAGLSLKFIAIVKLIRVLTCVFVICVT